MKKVKFINRYGDVYFFTLKEDGNISWEGNFEHCRFGWPNDYEKAFEAFQDRYTTSIPYKTFKEIVHIYDSEKRENVFKDILPLVTSKTDCISMVDPSGGPYITDGVDMGDLDESLRGRIVKEFKPTENGYEIICWNSVDQFAHETNS